MLNEVLKLESVTMIFQRMMGECMQWNEMLNE